MTAPSPKRPTAARGKTPPVARSPSPADRSPPRSTPTRAFSKSLSPLSDDDEADDDDDNGGDHGLIPKPSGQCGRLKRDGYSLEDTLKWGDDYQKIYVRDSHGFLICQRLSDIARIL